LLQYGMVRLQREASVDRTFSTLNTHGWQRKNPTAIPDL
jgi:hypothetical protein